MTIADDAVASLKRAGIRDSILAAIEIAVPTISKGVIVRRPKMVAVAERFGLDDRAVRRMQKLRAKYGIGPLLLKLPGRPRIVVLAPGDVQRILAGTPEPFATRTDEKHAALAHFEPKVALISHGAKRAERRQFNERVLETEQPVHNLAENFKRVVDEEVDILLNEVGDGGKLAWQHFFPAWYRIVRRVVFGDEARDDHDLTDMLAKLRSRGNWASFRRKDEQLRRSFHDRLNAHLARAEVGSLAGIIASIESDASTAPSHQVAQWLFAFDPGGMATFRSLALLATHPEQNARAREEVRQSAGRPMALPFLRATLLEALRLWPTTPAILRQTTRQVAWGNSLLPANATMMIFAPFFHRDEENLEFAHRFAPELWLENKAGDWPLIPFSGGPGVCPARNFVPLIASLTLARLLKDNNVILRSRHGLERQSRLPGTLDNYRLEFALEACIKNPGSAAERAV